MAGDSVCKLRDVAEDGSGGASPVSGAAAGTGSLGSEVLVRRALAERAV